MTGSTLNDDVRFPPLPTRCRVAFFNTQPRLLATLKNYCRLDLDFDLDTMLQRVGVKDALFLDSATSGLITALRDMHVERGDEVIIPSYVCKAVINAVTATGATPVYADIDEHYQMTPRSVADALTSQTRAVILVHQYGFTSDTNSIARLCHEHHVVLIEDSAITIGAHYNDQDHRLVGSTGDYAVYSFNIGKTITGFGGGLLTKKHDRFYTTLPQHRVTPTQALSFLAHHHRQTLIPLYNLLIRLGLMRREENIAALYERTNRRPFTHEAKRMSRLQMASALAQLTHLDRTHNQQGRIAQKYFKNLAGIKQLTLPPANNDAYTYYPIKVKERYALSAYLAAHGVETQWTFLPLHQQKKFSHYKRGRLPVTDKLWKEELSLPIGPRMTEAQARYVSAVIQDYYRGRP